MDVWAVLLVWHTPQSRVLQAHIRDACLPPSACVVILHGVQTAKWRPTTTLPTNYLRTYLLLLLLLGHGRGRDTPRFLEGRARFVSLRAEPRFVSLMAEPASFP